jgi:hypothetical protein
MAVVIPNFEYSYLRKGKSVFVPTSIGRRIGRELKLAVEGLYEFDPIYFHLRRGGHVAAMHHHREHRLFARIDISRFFYSISRRRVQSALDRIGIVNPRFYAKWSTVLNPHDDPKFALPYGFVQSPILASLVLATSDVGAILTAIEPSVSVGVYMDDISLSSDDHSDLCKSFDKVLAGLEADGFAINQQKLRTPAAEIDIFNCDLSTGKTSVSDTRIEEFFANGPDEFAEEAFISYCASVEVGNQP